MKRTYKDIFVIGFALFSMFFGAGNVIFPPYLGLGSGPEWLTGFVCYYLADIGLALLALFAMLRRGGADGITGPIGRIPSALLMCAIVLCIGPMLAIPRTGATTYEMSILPLLPKLSAPVFSVLFFLLIFFLCIKESAVVDIVGKVLTPALLIGLLVLIIVGVVSPIGPIAAAAQVENVPGTGVEAGYQTMDVLAALVFGLIILQSAEDKGYTEKKARSQVVAGSGIVAGAALLVVYLGLTYLGATSSSFFDMSVNRSALVLSIVEMLLGKPGLVIFAVVVALACITTAVALTSSAASFFSRMTRQRLPYTALVTLICLFSTVVSNFGLDQIVAIAAPILNIVYPPALVLIILSYFPRSLPVLVHRLAVVGALLTSLLTTVSSYGVSIPLLDRLPFASLGFGWLVPATVFGLAGLLLGGFGGGERQPLPQEAPEG